MKAPSPVKEHDHQPIVRGRNSDLTVLVSSQHDIPLRRILRPRDTSPGRLGLHDGRMNCTGGAVLGPHRQRPQITSVRRGKTVHGLEIPTLPTNRQLKSQQSSNNRIVGAKVDRVFKVMARITFCTATARPCFATPCGSCCGQFSSARFFHFRMPWRANTELLEIT